MTQSDPDMRLAKEAAWHEAIGWYLKQAPWAVVLATGAGAVLLLVFHRPWPVVVGGIGLAISTLAAWWLAASLFPTDDEVSTAGTFGSAGARTRRPALLRDRERARIAIYVLMVGFGLQYAGLIQAA